jgi:hypothetical protein
MNIEDLTLKQIREINKIFGEKPITVEHDDSHWQVGKLYFIRTVTMNHTGKLVKVSDKELVLEGAAWIADSGRFTQALESGDFSEVEMFPKAEPVIIGRSALIDATVISKTPNSQK